METPTPTPLPAPRRARPQSRRLPADVSTSATSTRALRGRGRGPVGRAAATAPSGARRPGRHHPPHPTSALLADPADPARRSRQCACCSRCGAENAARSGVARRRRRRFRLLADPADSPQTSLPLRRGHGLCEDGRRPGGASPQRPPSEAGRPGRHHPRHPTSALLAEPADSPQRHLPLRRGRGLCEDGRAPPAEPHRPRQERGGRGAQKSVTAPSSSDHVRSHCSSGFSEVSSAPSCSSKVFSWVTRA